MNQPYIVLTPSRFKIIVAIWTILGLIFIVGFLSGAILTVGDLSRASFQFKSFPFFTIVSLLISVLFPFVFILYYYSRLTLKQRPASILKWLFIIFTPLLIYVWVTVFPLMRILDVVYEVVFLLLHIIVFLKFPSYFNTLSLKKPSSAIVKD